MPQLILSPLQPDSLHELRELLGGSDFGGCFCAVWTGFGEGWGDRCSDPEQPNYEITRRDVEDGRRAGFFIREGPELIGWTGAGPAPEFPQLAKWPGSRLSSLDASTWVIGCIALRAQHRGRGTAARVIEAVVARAEGEGAEAIEAFPALPWSEPRSYRGSFSTYERLGFVEQGRQPSGDVAIVHMRRRLGPAH